MSVISCTAGNQFAAEAGVFIYIEHVYADVWHASINGLINGNVPARDGLVRQSGDSVGGAVGIVIAAVGAIASSCGTALTGMTATPLASAQATTRTNIDVPRSPFA